MNKILKWTRRRGDRGGFTAVEVTMVAAVIAILTLIALPIFRKRVEEARYKSALDEMQVLAEAELLAYAETGHYFRLNDLDNTTQYTDGDTSAPLSVPVAVWNRELDLTVYGERWQLANTQRVWNGPYVAFRSFVTLQDLLDNFDTNMLRDQFEPDSVNNRGPILLLSDVAGLPAEDSPDDKYPVDPWGNPYFFFGAEGQMVPGNSNSRIYPNAWIVSMGPDGLPGNDPAINSTNFWREGPDGAAQVGGRVALGSPDSDDIVYEF